AVNRSTFEGSRLRAGGASASLAEARGEPHRAEAGARRARREIPSNAFSATSAVSALNVIVTVSKGKSERATRLHVDRAPRRLDDDPHSRIGDHAAGTGDGHADARGGVAAGAAREADRERQVVGRPPSGRAQ